LSRQTSKQKYQDDADGKRRKSNEKTALKITTKEVAFRKRLGNNESQMSIIKRINKHMGSNISRKTVSQMVREGRIGISPLKKGPVGDFTKTV